MPEPQQYIEASAIGPKPGWRRIGSAERALIDDVEHFKLEGVIPGTDKFRSSVYRTPDREPAPGEMSTDRALEVNVPVMDIGELACKRWRDYLLDGEVLEIGMALLRIFAESKEGFNEFQAALLEHTIVTSAKTPVASALVGVETSARNNFSDSILKFMFRYHSEARFFPKAQIENWLESVGGYIVKRGLTETLIGMLGEGQSLQELLEAGPISLPLPTNANRRNSFFDLLPETLRLRESIHDIHPQIEMNQYQVQVRIPLARGVGPEISTLLNQSTLASALRQNGFSISYCDGLADFMPDRNPDSDETVHIRDILPFLPDLESASFGDSERRASTYRGPYLHLLAEHGKDSTSRTDALTGVLLFVYRFRDYFSGINSIDPG